MDANKLIADWQRRLNSLADKPQHAFRDTPQDLIDAYEQRLRTFIGFSELEVDDAERSLGVQFPEVFRTYLLEMGKSPGNLFRGSDLVDIRETYKSQQWAERLIGKQHPSFRLPRECVVFMSHQGYTFVCVSAVGGFDGPPLQWLESRETPRKVADTFAAMVDAELRLAEKLNRSIRAKGGHYLTLFRGGGSGEEHPSIASGIRPLGEIPEDQL